MKILRKFTIDDKLKCIEMVSQMGYQQVSELTGIDRKSLREWNRNKEKLKKITNKEKTFRLPGGGAKPKTLKIENLLIEFIKKCRKIGLNVNSKVVIDELCRIDPNMLNKSRKALRNWCYRFFKRHNYP